VLSVSDTGCGMDERTKAQLFEPFFTTKELGKGTGLGLALVYSIVQQSGGHIDVASAPGRGSTFDIVLPAAQGRTARGWSEGRRTSSDVGAETMLLVEDEADVRALARLSLQQLGYTVLEAPGGPEALVLCEQYPGSIHLLVTDVVMPGMSGRQLAEALLTRRPGLAVLYVSGYPDDVLGPHGVRLEGVHFLQKPYTLTSLGKKVREVLDLVEAKGSVSPGG
jgi:CheY-like chemotaxis protein